MSDIRVQFRAEQTFTTDGGTRLAADRSTEAMQRLRQPFAVDTTIAGSTDRQRSTVLM
ncbi:hypothetical protein [Actinoplanes sp. NPDC023714]|uniref:hypothetical protein n=1 Tax=Actinoplanes sp. NPDC023714 TaxID=3154322 RepID=UPI0033C0EA57